MARNVADLLALSQQEELVDLPDSYPLSTSEDEGDSDGERKCQKLLEAVSSLGRTNKWKLAERSEASLMVSEFNVTSEGSGEKLVLSDLLGSATELSSLATVKKQLQRIKSKTLTIPLNKEVADRTLREAAFSKTSQMLSKWDPVVLKNRQAEQLVFPMEKELPAVAPIEHVFTGWKARTPLEQEVFNLLHKNKQPVTDPLLTPMEKASLKAMSLEEAKIRRAELQRTRALQSYYEARARREKRIKSKKYHRVLKKGKAKKALKEFEQLWKDCPSAALQELEKMEKARMTERMSLKHQGKGKWAKSKAIVAKYDLEARKAMQEQLAKNRELTQKLQVVSESEEDDEGTEERIVPVSDGMDDLRMNADAVNPWMLSSCNSSAEGGDIKTDPEQIPEFVTHASSESEGDERPVAEELVLKERSFQERVDSNNAKPLDIQETEDSNSQEVLSESRILLQKLNKENHQSEDQEVSSVETVLHIQREDLASEKFLVLQRLERAHVLEQRGELGKEEHYPKKELSGPVLKGVWKEMNPPTHPDASGGKKKKEQMIDLQTLLTTPSPPVKSLAVPTVQELEDEVETDHKQLIKEAFAGDDVIREFLKEKREAIEANKPKDLDLSLPGWGEWVGMGLKPSAKKRRRFLIKAPESSPRKDKNLPNVIINEKRNIHAAAYQVRAVPHPFTHHQQFERTIQNPIGYTWNTQRAFQKLTVPKVGTKLGHIIKPIKAENVGYHSSSRSDLSILQSNRKCLSRKQQKQLKKSSAD
ncbi:U3 small nucleolar RNA-associated protein 14 homolog B [Rattus norvegicus]|uniref:U3 small nucleolar RNA-associated protein 14 homolog B-like n=1 Tax=Rattus norvegicus TaxID=10116 RepID=A0A8I6A0H2_RAT|nr:U3 small nucleolar RNA-associated protein 14 homolog B [Rattus norvegicus]|eukprot:XP_006245370.1 PREDICTED: U3 small nucleolar RNA-associated protein 14 homolog B [Rattus norvegicus]